MKRTLLAMLVVSLLLSACGGDSAADDPSSSDTSFAVTDAQRKTFEDGVLAYEGRTGLNCAYTDGSEDAEARALTIARDQIALPESWTETDCSVFNSDGSEALPSCLGVSDPATAVASEVEGPAMGNSDQATARRADSFVRTRVFVTRDEQTAASFVASGNTDKTKQCLTDLFYSLYGVAADAEDGAPDVPQGWLAQRMSPQQYAVDDGEVTSDFTEDLYLAQKGKYLLLGTVTTPSADPAVTAAMIDAMKRKVAS